jgi:membrane protease subunit (stomatin/prohibitin family)
MAIIDRIKYDGPLGQAPWLVYKFPSEQLVLGSQLIVNKSQEAIFFKGGNALDVFGPGTHTLATANLPLLNKLVNLPFGGQTPFTAEIFFVNKTARLDLKWGTIDPFPVTEPRYAIIVNVRAYGQFGIKISDARNFTTQIVGALHGGDVTNHDTVMRYFKGLIVNKVKTALGELVVRDRISLLDITAHLESTSTACRERIAGEFDRFGLEVLIFFVESINIPAEDIARLKGILEDRAEFNLLGDERYTRKRSFDVLDTSARNESTSGALMNAGLGLGLGLGAGTAAGEVAKQMRISPPAQAGVRCAKCGAGNPEGTRFCAECGEKILSQKITCPGCQAENSESAKFCHQCGIALTARRCAKCGHDNSPGGKFCAECGAKLSD